MPIDEVQISRAACELAPQLVECMKEWTAEVHQELTEREQAEVSPDDGKAREKLAIEMSVITLHLIDRILFLQFGVEKRNVFMDALMPTVWLYMADGELTSVSLDEYRKIATDTGLGFSAFKQLFHEKGQPPKGTLFWEEAKHIGMTMYKEKNPIRVDLLQFRLMLMYQFLLEVLQKLPLWAMLSKD